MIFEERVITQTELFFYADVLDWVKSETGAEDGCPRDCPDGACPTRPPPPPPTTPPPPPTTTPPLPPTTTPPPDTCEDIMCSSICNNAKKCRKNRRCINLCKRHCNDAFDTGNVCNWVADFRISTLGRFNIEMSVWTYVINEININGPPQRRLSLTIHRLTS